MKNKSLERAGIIEKIIIWFCIIFIAYTFLDNFTEYKYNNEGNSGYSDKYFRIITTPENKVLEDTIIDIAGDNDFEVVVEYADNLEIVDLLNSGEKYDAVWVSNSLWLDMINSSVKTSNLKSTSISPIVFGVKKSLAESLGLTNKKVYMNDMLELISSGKLQFSMANPVTTNSGVSAYLNVISTLAGNPEVLTSKHLNDKNLQEKLQSFFKGLERTSGDEDFLEESFINGNYDAAFTYESSIININKKLAEQGRETLYLIYPVDGVFISDSPLVFINNGNETKKENFLNLQSYFLGNEGQKKLMSLGRRTWYGGVNSNVDKSIFNPSWGIDTTKYISPVNYPSKDVIKEALRLYQDLLRKPVHVVFCLDYSGSMYGEGIDELIKAMEFVLGDEALTNMIQFSSRDKIDIIPFSSKPESVWSTNDGSKTDSLLDMIRSHKTGGTTALYDAIIEAFNILEQESNEYNVSVIAMTDGEINVGSYNSLRMKYNKLEREVPVYSIMFGYADREQLDEISSLTNGKTFNGTTDLVKAFKTVRGYN